MGHSPAFCMGTSSATQGKAISMGRTKVGVVEGEMLYVIQSRLAVKQNRMKRKQVEQEHTYMTACAVLLL